MAMLDDSGTTAITPDDGGAAATAGSEGGGLTARVQTQVRESLDLATLASRSRRELAREVGACLDDVLRSDGKQLDMLSQRNVVTDVLNALLSEAKAAETAPAPADGGAQVDPAPSAESPPTPEAAE